MKDPKGMISESTVESLCLGWLESLGCSVLNGPAIAPCEPATERDSYEQVVLAGRLRDALAALNPIIPGEAVDEAFRKLTHLDSPSLAEAADFHHWLVNGVSQESLRRDGGTACDRIHSTPSNIQRSSSDG